MHWNGNIRIYNNMQICESLGSMIDLTAEGVSYESLHELGMYNVNDILRGA